MAELTGKVIAVLPLESGVSNRTGNEWASQEYVIEEVGVQYPQRLCFRVFGKDKIQQYSIFPDEIIKVNFSFNCREHNGKWYNEINCWNVERPQAAQPTQQQIAQQVQQQVQQGYEQSTQPQPQYPAQQGYEATQQGYAPQPQVQHQYPPQGWYQQAPPTQSQQDGLPF